MSDTNSIFEASVLLIFIMPKKTEERQSNLQPLLSAQLKPEVSYRYAAEYTNSSQSIGCT